MGGGDYPVMLELTLFITAQWLAGRCFRSFGAPPILAEMIAGVILGPEVADIVPYAREVHYDNGKHDPSVLVLVGNIGVALMIFESGMHLHFDKVAQVGKQALFIGLVGTMAPIAIGLGTAKLLGFSAYPEGLSIGIALAPTSVGISLKMLGDAKFLNSRTGQTIITAAFIDDIFSLVMLVILVNASKGDITADAIILPLVYSFAFVGFGAFIAVKYMPKVKHILNFVGEHKTAALQPRDEMHIALMVIVVVFFGWIGSMIGSHLLGTFVAGMAFTNVQRSGLVWGRQAKRIVSWMMRLFFSASIAFSIPVSKMFTPEAFWKGLILAAVPCVGGKLLSGVLSGESKWMVGWAMVARGEFAYLVAQTAKDKECKSCDPLPDGSYPHMVSKEAYSTLVWALVWSTILAPVCFKHVLKTFIKQRGPVDRAQTIGGALATQKGQRFVVRLVGQHHVGVLHEVMQVLHDCELDVLEAHAESDNVVDVDRFVVMPRTGGDLDDEKLAEIADRVTEAVNDEEAQVVFEPLDLDKKLEEEGVLQIRMIGDYHPAVVHEIFDVLAEEDLDVLRAVVDEHVAMGGHHNHEHGQVFLPAGLYSPGRAAFTRRLSSMTNLGKAIAREHRSRSRSRGSSRDNSRENSPRVDRLDLPKPTEENIEKDTDSEETLDPKTARMKESESIYARHSVDPSTGKRKPVSAETRERLRERIMQLLESHQCHGEVMLRMVDKTEANEVAHPITAIEDGDKICVVTTSGAHHPAIIHELLDALSSLKLAVVHADIVQPGQINEKDNTLMYVRNSDTTPRNSKNPNSKNPASSITDPERCKEIKEELKRVFASHGINGVVTVKPLEDQRRGTVISQNISATTNVEGSPNWVATDRSETPAPEPPMLNITEPSPSLGRRRDESDSTSLA